MLLELFVIFFTSVITASLVFYRIPVNNLHQGLIFVLIITLIYVGKVVFVKGKEVSLSHNAVLILLFLTSILVQVLVVSTGGFYSPLLITVHIYILATGFLTNLSSSFTFLVFTLTILGGQLWWDPNLQIMLKNDPGITVIYVASLVIIVPLAQFVMKTYKVKDKLSQALGSYLHTGRQREESMLSGLNELIFITDKDLKVISVSDSAQTLLRLSNEEVSKKNLLDVVEIVAEDGKKATFEQLPIQEILTDKAIRIVKDMHLITPTGQNTSIIIQIKPIKDTKGDVSQLVFIVTDARLSLDTKGQHKDLPEVISRYQANLDNLRKTVAQINSPQASQMVEILSHIEEDMRTVLEMEDHPLKANISFDDVAFISKQALEGKKSFGRSLGVNLQFVLSPQEIQEAAAIKLKEQNVDARSISKSAFTVPVDTAWFKLLIQKLLDIGILICSGEQESKIELLAERSEENISIEVAIHTKQINQKQTEELFIKNYGSLGISTNLRLGSGIEGYLAHAIAVELKLPLAVRVAGYPSRLLFTISIPVKPNR